MRHWLLLVLLFGCSTKTNPKYCDTTCPDGMTCDQVAHVCVAGMPDLAVPDMEKPADLSVAIDLNGIDLLNADFTPVPACTASTMCPDGVPICDSTSKMCRSCTSAGDDGDCASHSASTPHCKLSGANAGFCAACNVSADCPTATPVCNPDGTCRACADNSECSSLICDTGSGACVPESDVVYVNGANDPGMGSCTDGAPGGKDGSKAHPYCQITTALTLIGVQTRHYVYVYGSTNTYNQFAVSNTSGTLIFLGPGKDATPPATVQAGTNNNAVDISPTGAMTVSIGISGFNFVGNGSASVLVCDGGGVNTPDLTVIDSSFSTSNNQGLFLNNCSVKVSQSRITGANQNGIYLGPQSRYNIQNCFIYGNDTGVQFFSANGSFYFNTVAQNGGTVGIDCATAGVVVQDSIVFANKTMGNSQFKTPASCTLSNVVTGAADTIASSGKIALDPALVSATDLHLDLTAGAKLSKNQACCIDKINGLGPAPSPSPLPTVDIDNNPRPKGAHWDIGADEAM
jgi:hypothetical protein